MLGAFLRKTEIDMASPLTFESPARSIIYVSEVGGMHLLYFKQFKYTEATYKRYFCMESGVVTDNRKQKAK